MGEIPYLTYDIVVLGGGGAAALAAIEAAEAGASVALLTKESSLVGGATIMAAAGTATAISPEDTTDRFVADILKSGRNLNNTEMVTMLAEKSVGGLLGLEKYGFLLDRKDPESLYAIFQREGHSLPRSYSDRREALGICHGLSKAVVRSGAAIYPEMVAAKILTHDGKAAGVVGFSMATGEYVVFNAKAVLLATGGLGGLYEVTTNASVLTGDGFAMAWDCGAELVDMEMVQYLPLAFPYPKNRRGKMIGMCSMFGKGVKLYNGQHERYMSNYDAERLEFGTRDVVARANYNEIREGRGTKNGAILVDPTEHDPEVYRKWKITVPHHYALHRQVFGEEAAKWKVSFEAIPSQHFFMGGVVINKQFQTTVPGLFAVGEVTGGIHGANRLAGVAFAEIFTFGPIAGRSVAEFVKGETLATLDRNEIDREVKAGDAKLSESKGGSRPYELKATIQSVMWYKVGPVRDAARLNEAIAQLKEVERAAEENMTLYSSSRIYNRERVEAIEVPFMARTALLVAESALARQESRGSHYRTDFPAIDETNWCKNIVHRKKENGADVLSLVETHK